MDQISKVKGRDGKGSKQRKQSKPKNAEDKNKNKNKNTEDQCSRSLGPQHPKRLCPARESKCRYCSKVAHWAKACKSNPGKRVSKVNLSQHHEENFFIGEVTELDTVSVDTRESWMAEVKFNGRKVGFKLDTGADVTVIPPSLYQSLKPTPLLSKTTKLIMGPCKQKLNCL